MKNQSSTNPSLAAWSSSALQAPSHSVPVDEVGRFTVRNQSPCGGSGMGS
jgi:hypothetical protein